MAMLNNQRVYIYITSILIQEFWGTRNAIMGIPESRCSSQDSGPPVERSRSNRW